MIKKLLIILLVNMLLISGCREGYITVDDCYNYDYSDCITMKYSTSFIYMNFSLNDENDNIPYTLYEGSVDNGEVLLQDTAFKENITLEGSFDIPYSVKAEYLVNGEKIYVIDGGTAIRWDQEVCDSTCWHYEDIELDLKLDN